MSFKKAPIPLLIFAEAWRDRRRITVVSWLWKEDSFDTTPRAQCRLVMPFQYQTVHNFGSLRELLTAFFEAICDYEKLHNRGICHRNVCPRNIIVDPASGKGRLISLDYAEYDKRYKPKTIAEIVHDDARKLLSMAFMFQEDLPRNLVIEDELTWALVSSPNVQDSDTAFEMLVNLRKDRIAELEKAGKPIHFSPTFGFADLGLPISAQTLVPPNFQPWSGINFIRTGAMSFMSHDLIWDFLKQEIVYSAIHDMDSFLQTLVHICLTREGPRGRTIKDLHDNRDTYSALRLRQSDDVENAVRQLFTDDPRDTRERKKYFLESQEERDRICDLFNVYFLPLKPLIDTWARILDRVFNRRRPEESTLYTFYPIQAVKGAISETIEKLSSPAIQSSSSRLPVGGGDS
ncbi:hypothetical protein CPC08DRAFT_762344 [Agrocybe pediades]|nr:hypothetical protein CPC08DRAFT_762344 [Agrocybe pediades]